MNIEYKIKTATEKEINGHLNVCNDNFIPSLNDRVDLTDFSKKIFEKSVTFEAWNNGIMVGMLSAYFNDAENYSGYITNVSVMKKYMGIGIASALMNMCIDYAKKSHFREIKLEVNKNNNQVIELYEKFNFKIIESSSDFVMMRLTLI